MIRPLLIATALLVAPVGGAAQTPGPPPTAACADAEHGQFDFWVGRWTVTPTARPATIVASSLIEKVYGCGIRENWMPKVANGDGGSLSIYVPAQKAWRQTWIDSSGAYVDFKGGWNGQAMILTGNWPGPDGKPSLTQMTYTQGADGSVRQAGAVSKDGGKTWTPSFDFTYRKAGD